LLVVIATVLDSGESWLIECLVVMVIERYLLDIIVSEKIVPLVHVVSERVVEHEIGLRSVFLNHLSYLSVEVLENDKISVPPWLIDWLEGSEGTVVTPSLEETLSNVETPLEVGVVDVVNLITCPWTNPVGMTLWPVGKVEVCILVPNDWSCFTAIIESIL